ncbi:MAG: helix-turn-helix domain-containing protein [Solirubrobacterales bacterium]
MPTSAPDLNLSVNLDLDQLADALVERFLDRLPQPDQRRTSLTSAEAAHYLGISVEAIRDLAACRKVAFSQTCAGAPCYFEADDLDAYRRKHRNEAVN